MEWYFTYICAGRLKRKWKLWSGSNRHSYFVVFFSVSVQALNRDQPFYGYSEKPPHFSRILRRAWGYGGPIVVVHPGSPGRNCKQCVNESWSKDHHRRYWIWYCFVLSVSFALFCVLAWNLSFKQNWSAFAYNTKYSEPNIIYTQVSWTKNYII